MKNLRVSTIVSAGALCLLTAASAAYAQNGQQNPSAPMNQLSAQQAATATEQQMRDTSAGGVPGQRTQSGTRIVYGAPCNLGGFCDIYHGH